MDFISQQWLNHCRHKSNWRPRKIGYVKDPSPLRKKWVIETQSDFLKEMWIHLSAIDLYVAVFSEDEKEKQRFDTIYLDIDSEDLDEAHADLVVLCDYYHNKEGILPRVYFTGGKGFSVNLDFHLLGFKYYKHIVRDYIEDLEDKLKLTCLDHSVIGDYERISRLPYSQHMKSNRMCIPVSPFWDLDVMINRSEGKDIKAKQLPVRFTPAKKLRTILKSLDENYVEPKAEPVQINGSHKDTLAKIMAYAPRIKGVKRILWCKVLPIMKRGGKTEKEMLHQCKYICNRAGRKWEDSLERWLIAAYEVERGIPWSWKKIYQKWPEIEGWFK